MTSYLELGFVGHLHHMCLRHLVLHKSLGHHLLPHEHLLLDTPFGAFDPLNSHLVLHFLLYEHRICRSAFHHSLTLLHSPSFVHLLEDQLSGKDLFLDVEPTLSHFKQFLRILVPQHHQVHKPFEVVGLRVKSTRSTFSPLKQILHIIMIVDNKFNRSNDGIEMPIGK